ncbi:hypothetical protein DVH24_010502 [Malus domestica]|uniref:Uncharacterized protein n=1 Tax=Malus domestica TaxID=3750 RepID=A0A498JTA2_MALDO|nr:hypothetical protein DVH24_010502 [Malus domestica]
MVCIKMGCDAVDIESNSQRLLWSVLSMIFGHLASQLGGVRFVFAKRNENAAAHAVASYVASHGDIFH